MRRVLLLLILSACGSSDNLCRWPADTLGDGGSAGCTAGATFTVCEANSDGSRSCRSQCTASQYALTCFNDTPSAALHCQLLPLPMPQGQSTYCCSCL